MLHVCTRNGSIINNIPMVTLGVVHIISTSCCNNNYTTFGNTNIRLRSVTVSLLNIIHNPTTTNTTNTIKALSLQPLITCSHHPRKDEPHSQSKATHTSRRDCHLPVVATIIKVGSVAQSVIKPQIHYTKNHPPLLCS
jgi:hypothetical protein